MDDKIKVLIASVLKPADDVRSYRKIGQSLAQTNKYEVNIIGFDSKKKSDTENIFLHPVFKFNRNSVKRFFAPIRILQKCLQLRPQVIIVNTPELLPVIYLIKILFGVKIIYDVQENYRLNTKYSKLGSPFTKFLSLVYLKLVEGISPYLLNGYILAEDCYLEQLEFPRKKPWLKLLNKSTLPLKSTKKPFKIAPNGSIQLIYSGTIGREYGTLEAVKFCENLFNYNDTITLTIIGYCADSKYLNTLLNNIKEKKFIQLITEDKPVDQSRIIQEIENSDVALLPYQLNPNLASRFPTKIYDYLALGVPMIIPPHNDWERYLDRYKASLTCDFQDPNIPELIHQFSEKLFYTYQPKEEILWKSQEQQLLNFVRKIISK